MAFQEILDSSSNGDIFMNFSLYFESAYPSGHFSIVYVLVDSESYHRIDEILNFYIRKFQPIGPTLRFKIDLLYKLSGKKIFFDESIGYYKIPIELSILDYFYIGKECFVIQRFLTRGEPIDLKIAIIHSHDPEINISYPKKITYECSFRDDIDYGPGLANIYLCYNYDFHDIMIHHQDESHKFIFVPVKLSEITNIINDRESRFDLIKELHEEVKSNYDNFVYGETKVLKNLNSYSRLIDHIT